MANMYQGGPNFKNLDELKAYVDWVAKENNIDHATALAAIAQAGHVTIQGRNIANWGGLDDDDTLKQLVPELEPVVGEPGYVAPKSFEETLGDTIIEGVKKDIVSYPKRKLWELATGGYFNGEKVNTKKILDDAGVGKKGNKKTDKETTKPDKTEGEKTSSGLLKFGKDATSINQIETRDKELAKILNEKGITDIATVEEFLNHFNSFKEATPENRQRTISRIYGNIKDLNKTSQEEEKPQWIYIDQEDYKGTPEAKEGLDMYNKYAQVEAEKGDSAKVFKDMMGEAPTSHNTNAVRVKLKDAGLSTAQINDFTQAWADAYYNVDNGSPINNINSGNNEEKNKFNIDMNEDILNGAGDKEQIKVEKKEEKKNDNKKIKIKDIKKAIQKDPNIQKVIQNSSVIQGLLNIKKGK